MFIEVSATLMFSFVQPAAGLGTKNRSILCPFLFVKIPLSTVRVILEGKAENRRSVSITQVYVLLFSDLNSSHLFKLSLSSDSCSIYKYSPLLQQNSSISMEHMPNRFFIIRVLLG